MINKEIRQFRNTILGIAQASPLPIEIKRLVLAEILTAANKEADEEINNEIARQQAEANKTTEESEEEINE